MSKDAGLEAAAKKVTDFLSVSGDAVLEDSSDVCCGKMTVLLASSTQSLSSPTQCIKYSWSPLGYVLPLLLKSSPKCVWPCVVRSTSECISSVLLPLLWPLPTVLVHGCGRTCHAASAPVSAEVYTCSPSLLLEVYRKKLDCPGQLRWPNSS